MSEAQKKHRVDFVDEIGCVSGCVCVVCVAAEPPPSSGNFMGDAGAAALAGALEKNTSLQTLKLTSEISFFLIIFE